MEIYCQSCKCWVRVPRGESFRGTRIEHKKLCAGEPMNHPDLIELAVEMEYWFGEEQR